MSQPRVTLPVVLEHYGSAVIAKAVASLNLPVPYEPGPSDPWELRDQFLTCVPEECEGFVERTGAFGLAQFSKNDFVEWQNLVREALLRDPWKWRELKSQFDRTKVRRLFEPQQITFAWDAAMAPSAKILTTDTLAAVIATLQVDVLRGAKFKVCARTDCVNPPFRVEAHRNKIYCSTECGHLVAVRNSRARVAKTKRHRKRTAKKKARR